MGKPTFRTTPTRQWMKSREDTKGEGTTKSGACVTGTGVTTI